MCPFPFFPNSWFQGRCTRWTLKGPFVCVLLGIVVLLPTQGWTQSAEADHLEVGTGVGFLIPHRASIRSLIDGHAHQLHVNWTRKGQGLWSCSRSAPRWGFGFRIGTTGASQSIGLQGSVLSMADLKLARSLRIRLGVGVGWTQKPWSSLTSEGRQRVVIGSPINAAIDVGIHRPASFEPSANWHERVGIHLTLSHQSNASFTQPNLGTNLAALSFTAPVWQQSRSFKAHSNSTQVLAWIPPAVSGWMVYGSVGRRQPAPLDQRETTAEWGLHRRLGRGQRLGALIGAGSFHRPRARGVGIHAGFELRFTRIYIDLVHGRYLQSWQPEEKSYNQVTLNVHLRKGAWARLGLHTHGFRAHHPALGLGWMLNDKTPSGEQFNR